jgi:hypothetical protein
MIRHPYPDEQSRHAARQRMVYYGLPGMVDPRTYTLDPYIFVRAGLSWKAAMALSLKMAVGTSMVLAAAGYIGMDPMNVTPGHGISPGSTPVPFDVSQIMM